MRSAHVSNVVAALRAAGCVFAEAEAALLIAAAAEGDPADAPSLLDGMVGRRVAGEPLEHVVGWAHFYGRRICVAPGVFVPRRRTEFLVRRAARLVRTGAVVVDMCCGSGAVGATLGAEAPGAEIHAVDIDPRAVACANRNLAPLGSHVYQGNLFHALPAVLRGRVNVIVANAPHVPTAEIALQPREARLHEPHAALDGGPDGVEIHRRLATRAPSWLAPAGHLLIETGERQAAATAAAMETAGLSTSIDYDDELEVSVVSGIRN